MELQEERSSWWAMSEYRSDILLVAKRLLEFYGGGPQPTYEEEEFIEALDRMEKRLDDAPIALTCRMGERVTDLRKRDGFRAAEVNPSFPAKDTAAAEGDRHALFAGGTGRGTRGDGDRVNRADGRLWRRQQQHGDSE
jgi:hypothetical protein